MDIMDLVEKAAKALDERGRVPFTEEDIANYIKAHLSKNVSLEEVSSAVGNLVLTKDNNNANLQRRKCLYRDERGGYCYLHVCSFGVS